jgi:hypothetical protein
VDLEHFPDAVALKGAVEVGDVGRGTSLEVVGGVVVLAADAVVVQCDPPVPEAGARDVLSAWRSGSVVT